MRATVLGEPLHSRGSFIQELHHVLPVNSKEKSSCVCQEEEKVTILNIPHLFSVTKAYSPVKKDFLHSCAQEDLRDPIFPCTLLLLLRGILFFIKSLRC